MDNIINQTAKHLQKTPRQIFLEACLKHDVNDGRRAMFFSAYETEGFIPDFIEAWCLMKLLGTQAKKRSQE